jgi:hypothetical protein
VPIAQIAGPGMIRHLWLTVAPSLWRCMLLRAHWEHDPEPAILAPLGDFFCQGFGEFAPLSSQFITVAPHGGLNCYWPMPFREYADLSLENLAEKPATVYYQIDYTLEDVPADAAYLHAEWRRSAPVGEREDHTILSEVHGRTGTEDYFGGAWNFDVPGQGYTPYCSPFLGLHQVVKPDGRYLPRRDDLASTAWWYQDNPGGRLRVAPTLDQMEIGSRP